MFVIIDKYDPSFQLIILQNRETMIKWFFCCCPRKKPDQDLEHSLIEKDSSEAITFTNTDISGRKTNEVETKGSQNLQKEESQDEAGEQLDVESIGRQGQQYTKALSRKDSELKDQISHHNQVISYRKMSSPRDRDKIIQCKLSDLWKQKVKSDLIYLNFEKENPIYMSYRLLRNTARDNYTNPLQYYLSNNQNTVIAVIAKDSMVIPHIDILQKFNHKIINLVLGKNYVDLKQSTMYFKKLEVIYTERPTGIRWAGINQILIMMDGLFCYEDIYQYVTRIIRNFSWEELKKTSYIFPYFMTIDQISQIIFPFFRLFAFNEKIENVSVDLAFEMELIETNNSDKVIIVKCRSEDRKQKFAIYDQIKTSMAFFGKPFNNRSCFLFRDFFKIIRELKFVVFFSLKQQHYKWPKQFRRKVKEMQKLDQNVYSTLDQIEDLQKTTCEMGGFYYSIPQNIRQSIGQFYNHTELQKHEIQTPVRKQWDDDATPEDFKVYTKAKLDNITEDQLKKAEKVFGFGNDDSSDDSSDNQQLNQMKNGKYHKVEQHLFHSQKTIPRVNLYYQDQQSRAHENENEQQAINQKYSKLYYNYHKKDNRNE